LELVIIKKIENYEEGIRNSVIIKLRAKMAYCN